MELLPEIEPYNVRPAALHNASIPRRDASAIMAMGAWRQRLTNGGFRQLAGVSGQLRALGALYPERSPCVGPRTTMDVLPKGQI
jgi:hypothetical protein